MLLLSSLHLLTSILLLITFTYLISTDLTCTCVGVLSVIVLDSESIAAFAGAMLSAAVLAFTGIICCDGCDGGNGMNVESCVLTRAVVSETASQLWLERLDLLDAIASMAVNLA